MWQLRGAVLRLIALAGVWITAVVLLHYAAIGFTESVGANDAVMGYFLIVLIGGGFIVSDRILRLHINISQSDIPPVQRRSATEAQSLTLRDMLALLDNNDLDDLRDEIRETLRARVRRLSDVEDVESFEDLLTETSAKRKRGGR